MKLPPTNMEKCQCGWELPLSVFAYRNEVPGRTGLNDRVKGVHIELVCPRCKRGHAFYDADAFAPAASV